MTAKRREEIEVKLKEYQETGQITSTSYVTRTMPVQLPRSIRSTETTPWEEPNRKPESLMSIQAPESNGSLLSGCRSFRKMKRKNAKPCSESTMSLDDELQNIGEWLNSGEAYL